MTRNNIAILALVAVVTIGTARPAAADDLEPDDSTDAGSWYGGPALMIDGIAIALVAAGATWKGTAAVVMGAAAYALGGPINHSAHGHSGRALGSFVLRAVSVGTVGVLCATGNRDGGPTGFCAAGSAFIIGAAIGLPATIFDGLARDTPSVDERAPLRPAFSPTVLIGQNSSVVGLAGRF